MQSYLEYGVREFTQLTQHQQQKPSRSTLQHKSKKDIQSGRSNKKSNTFNDHDLERRLPSVEAESGLSDDLQLFDKIYKNASYSQSPTLLTQRNEAAYHRSKFRIYDKMRTLNNHTHSSKTDQDAMNELSDMNNKKIGNHYNSRNSSLVSEHSYEYRNLAPI